MPLPLDCELVLVDDGSNPPLNYEGALPNLRIIYTNDKRPWTQPLARNRGAREARGEYLFFTDIDHILSEPAVQAARSFDGDKMVFYRYMGILDRFGTVLSDAKSVLDFGYSRARFKRRGLHGGSHGNTYVIRKSLFWELGGYREDLAGIGAFHMGGKFNSEERSFNNKYRRREQSGVVKPTVVGPNIYCYPVSKFRDDGDNNPHGLFHKLSLEQIPQPMID